MNDPFAMRVRAAAVAGWWTVLIAIGFATVLWAVSLLVMSCRAAWFLALCGPDADWSKLQYTMLWAVVAFKIVVWLLVMAVIWLTLWARQLRK